MSGPIARDFGGVSISIRRDDRYFDATAMCQANGKRWNDYWRLDSTQEFIRALSSIAGIPAIELVQVRVGNGGGTWVHPRVATHLAQWCDARFAAVVSGWVEELLTTGRAELAASTGDPILDMLEQTRRASEQTSLALAGIAETRRQQIALQRQQAETHQLAERAQRTATAALCQAVSNHGYYTVLGYCRLNGREVTVAQSAEHGRELSDICRSRGVRIDQMNDPRFGFVNSYPESVLREYFGDTDTD